MRAPMPLTIFTAISLVILTVAHSHNTDDIPKDHRNQLRPLKQSTALSHKFTKYIHVKDPEFERIKIAKCRANCLNKIKSIKRNIKMDENIEMCWDFCEMLHVAAPIWTRMCHTPSICFDGCKIACKYVKSVDKSNHKSLKASNLHRLKIQSKYELKVDTSGAIGNDKDFCLNWNLIEAPPKAIGSIVYILFQRNYQAKAWEEIQQTTSNEYCLDQEGIHDKSAKTLLILAVNKYVIVAKGLIKSNKRTRYGSLKARNKLHSGQQEHFIEIKNERGKKLRRSLTISADPSNINIYRPNSIKSSRTNPTFGTQLKNEIILATCVIAVLTVSLIILTYYIWTILVIPGPQTLIKIEPPRKSIFERLHFHRNNCQPGEIDNARMFNLFTMLSLASVNRVPFKNQIATYFSNQTNSASRTNSRNDNLDYV